MGDGLLTAAWFISEARRRGATIAELAAAIPRYPQVLQNVPVTDTPRSTAPGRCGRLMVEPETEEVATRHADAISAAVRSSLG